MQQKVLAKVLKQVLDRLTLENQFEHDGGSHQDFGRYFRCCKGIDYSRRDLNNGSVGRSAFGVYLLTAKQL